ncbi:TonB family protein [Arenimonas donghaensis]|uniref:TonB C-terminal domain-containing protein n=1 Tax=Arenimonas donghaensis DSM 18148 = HO3-R19 TaxID=1121014 RepID=A0A087MHZ3_9GAMM|nr:TonB family protein [Arenimonas donghaensis]KFL36496.1 hypothetical protein N788_12750 [Arenimonas donghaensis DSM 18148 = HO3-R19]
MAAELFDWLLRSAWALALAAVLVMVLRPLWRRWLGAGAVLWLYLLLPAALMATSMPGPRVVVDAPVVALSERANPAGQSYEASRVFQGPAAISATASTPAAASRSFPREAVPGAARFPQVDAHTVAVLAWAMGALALAARMLVQQRRFRRRLGRLQRRDATLWQASADDIGPVVIGLLRPRIVVPSDFDHRYDAQQRQLVLAHERVHLRRGDLPVNALACVLRCLFWFNPLVHLAAAKLRLDQELACDAAVLARHPRAGRAYATALLNTQLADLGLPVGCAWQSSHPLTWRISMLKKPMPGPARLMLGAGLAVLASSAGAAALWQQQPATIVTLPAISLATAAAPLPPLAVQGQVAAPAPVAPASVVLAPATAAPSTPQASSAGVPSPAPVVTPAPSPAVEAVAPVAAPARPVATPAPEATPAPDAVPAVAPAAPVAQRAGHAPQRAPLPSPRVAERRFLYTDNVPLPPPPMPEDQVEAQVSEPKVLVIADGSPGAGAAGYQPPRIRLAKPARLPVLASVNPDSLVVSGMVMQVSVDATGTPVDVAVFDSKLSGVYERNALAAVKRWRFEPARSGGQAVASTVLVPVWFEGTSVSNFETEAMRHPRPQYRAPPQMVAGQ